MTDPDNLPTFWPEHCCVVAAWLPELEPLMAALPAELRRRMLCATIGIGLVEAAAGTARLIAEQHPEAILLVGTAGVYPGHERQLAVGSAAVVDQVVLLPTLLPDGAAYLPQQVPTRERSAPAMVRALREATALPLADTACPPAITASDEAAATAARLSGCALENLEAFAVARAAACAAVPFAAVLGVANRVGRDGHREWEQHGRKAAAAACAAVVALLRSRPNDDGASATR